MFLIKKVEDLILEINIKKKIKVWKHKASGTVVVKKKYYQVL